MKHLKLQFPMISDFEWDMIEQAILEEVIGGNHYTKNPMITIARNRYRDELKDEQRQKLKKLIWGEKSE